MIDLRYARLPRKRRRTMPLVYGGLVGCCWLAMIAARLVAPPYTHFSARARLCMLLDEGSRVGGAIALCAGVLWVISSKTARRSYSVWIALVAALVLVSGVL